MPTLLFRSLTTGSVLLGLAIPGHAEVTYTGELTTTIAIDVPPIRGLQPAVSLRYSSSAGNGVVGVGWGIDAVSVISHTGARGGLPIGPSDRFTLDGEELVPCAASSPSPSCSSAVIWRGSSAGFYSTRRESFQRIEHSGGTAPWTVWTIDGHVSQYDTFDGGRSWLLTSRTDRHANAIDYKYVCNPSSECELTAIRYGAYQGTPGVEVHFYYEGRPDSRYRGAGSEFLATSRRLRSISVQVGTSLLRAYALMYAASQSSGRSILSSVQQFGRDATVDTTTGLVTAGPTPPLPPTTYSVQSQGASTGWRFGTATTGALFAPPPSPPVPFPLILEHHYNGRSFKTGGYEEVMEDNELVWKPRPSQFLFGDFDGDGRGDIATGFVPQKCARVGIRALLTQRHGAIETKDSTSTATLPGAVTECTPVFWTADIDGDHDDDVIFKFRGRLFSAQLVGDTFRVGGSIAWGIADGHCSVGDIDGDSRDDLICHTSQFGSSQLVIAQSDGNGTFTTKYVQTGLSSADPMAVQDVNGDGFADVAIAANTGATRKLFLFRSLGNGTFDLEQQSTPWAVGASDELLAVEIDGDGLGDFLLAPKTIGANGGVALSAHGAGGRFEIRSIPLPWAKLLVGDFDGDGKVDIANGDDLSQGRTGDGNGGFVNAGGPFHYLPGADCDHAVVLDLDADDRGDLLCIHDPPSTAQVTAPVHLSDSPSVLPLGAVHRWLPGDFDGDGRTDFVNVLATNPGYDLVTVLTAGTGTRVPQTIQPSTAATPFDSPIATRWMVADVGGPANRADGKDDLVMVDVEAGTLRVYTLISNGNGTFTPKMDDPWKDPTSQQALPYPDLSRFWPADLDGDGAADLLQTVVDGGGLRVDMLKSLGNGTWRRFAPDPAKRYFVGSTIVAASDFRPMEVNGDGLVDLVHTHSGAGTGGTTIRTLVNVGDGTFAAVSDPQTSAWVDVARWRAMDLNGDGLSDLVHLRSWIAGSASGLQLDTLVSRGDGTFRAQQSGSASLIPGDIELTGALESTNSVHPMDINGDNLVDLVSVARYRDTAGYRHTVLTRMINPGTSSQFNTWAVEKEKVPRTRMPADTPWAWGSYRDFNRAESAGLVVFDGTQAATATFEIASDRLVKIGNGNGGETEITYAPFTGMRSYLPSGYAPIVATAVTRRDLSSSPPVAETTIYAYSGATWSDAQHRVLGYAIMGSQDGRLMTIARHRTDEICGGAIEQTMTIGPAFTLLAYIQNYFVATGSAAPYTCMVQQQSKYACDGGTCQLQSDMQYTYDVSGNVMESIERVDGAPMRSTLAFVWFNSEAYIGNLPMFRSVTQDGAFFSQRSFVYDSNSPMPGPLGETREVSNWDANAGAWVTGTAAYDASGMPTRTDDAAGGWSETTYDTTYNTFPTASCDAIGCSSDEWDVVLGKVTKSIDLNGNATVFEYDAHGRLVRVTRPDGGISEMRVLDLGRVTGPLVQRQRTRSTGSDGTADGNWTVEYLDGWGRVFRTEREGGATQLVEYDALSARPARVSEVFVVGTTPQHFTAFTYDALGRVLVEEAPDGTQKRWTYGVGTIEATDELGRVRRLTSDASGSITSVTETLNGTPHTTTYGYDIRGQLIGSADALGNVTSHYYDSLGRLVAESDPDRGLREYTYRGDGRLLSMTDRLGQRMDYTYDGASRLVERRDSDANGKKQRTVRWTYDELPGVGPQGASLGRVVQIDDDQPFAQLSTTYRYDVMGRVAQDRSCIDGDCYEMRYVYDVAGRLSKLTYPGSSGQLGNNDETVEHVYDNAGRLVSVGSYLTGIKYSVDDRPTYLSYGNGIATEYTYDPARRWLDAMSIGKVYSASYTRDALGRIVNLDEQAPTNADTMQFTYDDLGRMTHVVATNPQLERRFVFDPIGRITYSSKLGDYHYNDPDHPHAMTSADLGAQRAYDLNGNVTGTLDPSGRRLKIGWSVDDRPLFIDSATVGTFQFAYDASGRRVKKDGPSGKSLYPNTYVAVENGSFVKYYFAGDRLVARNSNGGVAYYHDDHSHATRVETDEKGNVVNSYQYDVVGEPVQENEAFDDDIGFGVVHGDQSLGLVYMNARTYDPTSAQFLSADSVVRDLYAPQSHDRYAFVEGDPVNYWDPSGHMREDIRMRMEEKQQMQALDQAFGGHGFGGTSTQADFCESAPQFCEGAVSETKVKRNDDGTILYVVQAGTGVTMAKIQAEVQIKDFLKTQAEARAQVKGSGGGGGGGGTAAMMKRLAGQVAMGAIVRKEVKRGGETTWEQKINEGPFKGVMLTITVTTDDNGQIVGTPLVGVDGSFIISKAVSVSAGGTTILVDLTADRGERTQGLVLKNLVAQTANTEHKLTGTTEGSLFDEALKIVGEIERTKSGGSTATFDNESNKGSVEKIGGSGSVTINITTPPPLPVVKEAPPPPPMPKSNGVYQIQIDGRTYTHDIYNGTQPDFPVWR